MAVESEGIGRAGLGGRGGFAAFEACCRKCRLPCSSRGVLDAAGSAGVDGIGCDSAITGSVVLAGLVVFASSAVGSEGGRGVETPGDAEIPVEGASVSVRPIQTVAVTNAPKTPSV